MKAGNALALMLAIMTTSAEVRAVTVVECVDKSGASSFRDHCPPGMAKKGEKEIRSSSKDADALTKVAAKNNPVVLYSVAHCDACDLVRKQLGDRKIPFTEKAVDEDADAQAALKKAAGQLTVPTVTVGAQVYTGYSKDALEHGLTQAGYPGDKAAAPESAASPGDAPPPVPEAPAPQPTPEPAPPATDS